MARDPRVAVPDAECEAFRCFSASLHASRFGVPPETGSRISRESVSNPVGRPRQRVPSNA